MDTIYNTAVLANAIKEIAREATQETLDAIGVATLKLRVDDLNTTSNSLCERVDRLDNSDVMSDLVTDAVKDAIEESNFVDEDALSEAVSEIERLIDRKADESDVESLQEESSKQEDALCDHESRISVVESAILNLASQEDAIAKAAQKAVDVGLRVDDLNSILNNVDAVCAANVVDITGMQTRLTVLEKKASRNDDTYADDTMNQMNERLVKLEQDNIALRDTLQAVAIIIKSFTK